MITGRMQIFSRDIKPLLRKLRREVERNEINYRLLEDTWFEILKSIPMPINYFEPESLLFRCRPNESDSEMFKNVEQISYNPNKEEISLNRFNKRKEQVFYASIDTGGNSEIDSIATPICESWKELFNPANDNTHKYLTISAWTINKRIPFINLGFDETVTQSDFLKHTTQELYSILTKEYTEPEFNKIKEVYNFIGNYAALKENSKSQNIYLITNAFYKANLRRHSQYENVLGILYPSPMTEKKGVNVVIPKVAVDQKYISAKKVIMYKCETSSNETKQYDIKPCSNVAIVNEDGIFNLIKLD